MREPLLDSIVDIAADLLEQVLPAIAEDSYILFGHSMGAYVALTALDRLVQIGAPLPIGLVLSGAPPPHRNQNRQHAHLPKQVFLDWIAAMGGVPAEVFCEPELMELFEPILRADVAAVEAYVDSARREYPIPVRVLVGRQDRIAYPDAQAWRECFTNDIEIVEFPGGHFFLFDGAEQIGVREAVERWKPIAIAPDYESLSPI